MPFLSPMCPCSDSRKTLIDLASLWYVQVSEILDSELLGEGFIPTLQLGKKNPKTVPYQATTVLHMEWFVAKQHRYGYVYRYRKDTDTRIRRFPKKTRYADMFT